MNKTTNATIALHKGTVASTMAANAGQPVKALDVEQPDDWFTMHATVRALVAEWGIETFLTLFDRANG